MSKTDIWMPLYIPDYLADTQHLSRDEHGAYLLLMMAYWRLGEALPDDDKKLSAIAKATPKEWKSLRPIMAEFFICSHAVWRHKRIDEELARCKQSVSQRSAAGKASARKRWGNETGNENVTGVITEPQRNEHETVKKSQSQSYKPKAEHTVDNSESASAGVVPTGIAGLCCKAMIDAGIQGCNPSHPTLLALLAAGADPPEFTQASTESVAKGKPSFAYVLGMVRRRREEAAKLVLHQGNMPKKGGNIHDIRAATIASLTGRDRQESTGNIIEGSASKLG